MGRAYYHYTTNTTTPLQNWGEGGSGLDYVILLSEGGGWVGSLLRLITEGGGGGGGKKCQKFDYVICERPLSYRRKFNLNT